MISAINNHQMFFILFMTLTCYSVVEISHDLAHSAGAGAWLAILVTALIFALAAMGIVYMNSMFKGQMLFDYAPSFVGKPVTCLIAILGTVTGLLSSIVIPIGLLLIAKAKNRKMKVNNAG